MDVPQPLLNLGYDPAMTATLFAVFKDKLENSIKQALANSPPLVSSPGTELKTKEKLKAADLRMSLLMGKIPEDSGLLIDAKTFAHLLSISSRTLSRLIDLKAVPMPVHLGRLVRWRLAEVLEWIEADCPLRKVGPAKVLMLLIEGRGDMRKIEYRHVLKPSIEYLEKCGRLLLDSSEMAEFLGITQKALTQLASTDRIPGPCRLGLETCMRWSVLELLEWVEAGCPRRNDRIKQRGRSGQYYS